MRASFQRLFPPQERPLESPVAPDGSGPWGDGRPTARRRAVPALTASRVLLLVPVGLLAVLGWALRWSNEDAFTYYRIVDNMVHGHGPVFNIGERVEAYTSPLWLGMLSLSRAAVPVVKLEWVAVMLALVLSVLGLFAACHGALVLSGGPRGSIPTLPLGALVVASLPAFWTYATSGLETGLAFAWLGLAFWGLVRLGARDRAPIPAEREPSVGALATMSSTRSWTGRIRASAPAALAVGIGLGPLVRPDLLIFSIGFLVALVALLQPRTAWGALRLVALAAALPAAYELFRMGYFAALVPNTALAKEAGAVLWGRGLEYFVDFFSTYLLWIPVTALLAWSALAVRGHLRAGAPRSALLVAVPVACGLLHGLYVVRLGGDYMHARLMLPSLFGLLAPVAVVAPARLRSAALLGLLLVPWAALCAAELRPSPTPPADPQRLQVYDKRGIYPGNPVTLDDYAAVEGKLLESAAVKRLGPERPAGRGAYLRRLSEERRAIVLDYSPAPGPAVPPGAPVGDPVPLDSVRPLEGLPANVVAFMGGIGRTGYAAGPQVRIVDMHGLADPVASRLRLSRVRRLRPGHEKMLPRAWVLARFAEPVPGGPSRLPVAPRRIAAARAALGCGRLGRILSATSAPLTPGRFLSNVVLAWRSRAFRLPANPVAAERELCRLPKPPRRA